MKKWGLSILALALLLINNISYSMSDDEEPSCSGETSSLAQRTTQQKKGKGKARASQETRQSDEEQQRERVDQCFSIYCSRLFEKFLPGQIEKCREDYRKTIGGDCPEEFLEGQAKSKIVCKLNIKSAMFLVHYNALLEGLASDEIEIRAIAAAAEHLLTKDENLFANSQESFFKEIDLTKLDQELANLIINCASERAKAKAMPILVRFRNLAEGLKIQIPKHNLRFILAGPQGSGKSVLGEAIARIAGCRCIRINCDALATKWLKSSTENLDGIFKFLNKTTEKFIIILDEIDKIDPKQQQTTSSDPNGSSDPDGMKTLDRLLTDLYDKENIILIGTTNHPDALPETTRDRFDEVVKYDFPGYKIRKTILSYILKKAVENNQLQAEALDKSYRKRLAGKTKGWSIRHIIQTFNDVLLEGLSKLVYQDAQKHDASLPCLITQSQQVTLDTAEDDYIRMPAEQLSQAMILRHRHTWLETLSYPFSQTLRFGRENPVITSAIIGGLGILARYLYANYSFTGKSEIAGRNISMSEAACSAFRYQAEHQGYQASNTDTGSISSGVAAVVHAEASVSYSSGKQWLAIGQDEARGILQTMDLEVPEDKDAEKAFNLVLNTWEGKNASARLAIFKKTIPDTSNLFNREDLQKAINDLPQRIIETVNQEEESARPEPVGYKNSFCVIL